MYHYNVNIHNVVVFSVFSCRLLNNFCKLLAIIVRFNEEKQINHEATLCQNVTVDLPKTLPSCLNTEKTENLLV